MEHPLFSLWKGVGKKGSISIAIDGSSYQYDDEALRYLSTLDLFDQFEVFYVSNNTINSKEKGLRILVPRIGQGGGKEEYRIDLEGQRYSFFPGFRNKETKEKYSAELLGSIAIGDLAITKKDIRSKYERDLIRDSFGGGKGYIGDMSECLSAIRAWINKKGVLNFNNRSSLIISKWMAISFALQRLLPNCKKAWRAAVVSKEENCPLGEGTVRDYIGSILSRAEHLLTTRDLLEVLKLDSFDRYGTHQVNYSYLANYYFGYFLMLLTGIIDSTETLSYWGICDRQKKPLSVSFRLGKNEKSHKKFLEEMFGFNKDLAKYVNSDEAQSLLKLIYTFRNHVAHEILPANITYVGNIGGLSGDLMVLKGKMIEKMDKYSKSRNLSKEQLLGIGVELRGKSGVPDKQEILVEPILFVRYMLLEGLKFIENVLGYIQLENIIISSTEEKEKYNRIGELPRTKSSFEPFEKVNEVMALMEASVP